MLNIIKNLIAYIRIPKGDYCYKAIGFSNHRYKIKLCPYWSRRTDKPYQLSGYCKYLKVGDWEHEGIGLLWDQVKQCGIKE